MQKLEMKKEEIYTGLTLDFLVYFYFIY